MLHCVEKTLIYQNSRAAAEIAECVPWYLPRLKNHSVCSPFQNKNFTASQDSVDLEIDCGHCLPDCSSTEYTVSQSEAEFRWESGQVR